MALKEALPAIWSLHAAGRSRSEPPIRLLMPNPSKR